MHILKHAILRILPFNKVSVITMHLSILQHLNLSIYDNEIGSI